MKRIANIPSPLPEHKRFGLHALENRIANQPVEHLYTFDLDGVPVNYLTGDKGKITLTYDDLEIPSRPGSKVFIPAAMMTHNHPGGSSALSAQDVFTSLTTDVPIRAVAGLSNVRQANEFYSSPPKAIKYAASYDSPSDDFATYLFKGTEPFHIHAAGHGDIRGGVSNSLGYGYNKAYRIATNLMGEKDLPKQLPTYETIQETIPPPQPHWTDMYELNLRDRIPLGEGRPDQGLAPEDVAYQYMLEDRMGRYGY